MSIGPPMSPGWRNPFVSTIHDSYGPSNAKADDRGANKTSAQLVPKIITSCDKFVFHLYLISNPSQFYPGSKRGHASQKKSRKIDHPSGFCGLINGHHDFHVAQTFLAGNARRT